MRLRRKPWIDEAILDFNDFVYTKGQSPSEEVKGHWHEIFNRQAPLYVELGTGKGDFISKTAALHPEVNFIGIELQQDVLYYAAKKVKELGLTNVRLMVFNIEQIENIFAEDEVEPFLYQLLRPMAKSSSCKRRLTYIGFRKISQTIKR